MRTTHFETQQIILEYLPKKAKIQILIATLNPMFINETQTKGINNRPWPNDYNWITNQRYKIWMPHGRIPDKLTVLEEPKEEAKPHVFFFFFLILFNPSLQWVQAIYKTWLKIGKYIKKCTK